MDHGNFIQQAWWWVEVHTGTVNESGPYYGFWSGFGSDIAELAILGGIVQYYRSHVCHDQRCHRWSHHVTPDGYRLCRKHIAMGIDDLQLHPIHSDHIPPEKVAPVKTPPVKRAPDGRFTK